MYDMKNRFFLLAFILVSATAGAQDSAKTILITDDLKIIPLSANAYVHVSWVTRAPFGRFTDNGLIYINSNEAVIMDTPMNDTLGNLLLDWFEKTFPGVVIKAVIVTHFHDDCLGALRSFHQRGIVSYANYMTNELLLSDSAVRPQKTFTGKLTLRIGKQNIENRYFGEGHSKDNIVTWVPSEKILFGGCMIKALDADRGYLGDANLQQWSATVRKVKAAYPKAKFVIPGHGNHGGTALLDFTIKMFEKDAK
jgi:metallo-beta-lactamase class B